MTIFQTMGRQFVNEPNHTLILEARDMEYSFKMILKTCVRNKLDIILAYESYLDHLPFVGINVCQFYYLSVCGKKQKKKLIVGYFYL